MSKFPIPHLSNMLPPSPPGLQALYNKCQTIYPNQPNPLQVSALVKYWLGGPDPLDYISMYSNPGSSECDIQPHWHYVSYGLSDLHGDGRVHPVTTDNTCSGFGVELTFRLKREPDETAPPTWPATLLQSLAKYVFQSGNALCAGDHIPWHAALDGNDSLIQHMFLINDPQLECVETQFGIVNFLQIVGVTKNELKAAQTWSVPGIISILSNIPKGAGGSKWLITDMKRNQSIFDLNHDSDAIIEAGIEQEGSSLSGVTAYSVFWINQLPSDNEKSVNSISESFQKSFITQSMQYDMYSPYSSTDLTSLDNKADSSEPVILEKLHLTFNMEAASVLPLAIRGRVRHGRHFTFKSATSTKAVTLVAESVTGKIVDYEKPFVVLGNGNWLQILLTNDFLQEFLDTLTPFINSQQQISLPKTFLWKKRNLAITVVPDPTLNTRSMIF